MNVWIGAMMDTSPAKSKEDEKRPVGTHQGRIADPEARARRKAKNVRNRGRGGQATRPRGSARAPFARRSPGRGVRSSR